MKIHFFLALSLSVFSLSAHAKKFALVVGGVQKANAIASIMPGNETPRHEFGMNTARVAYGLDRQGYEVTTLFDNAGIPDSNLPEGLRELRAASTQDYNQLGTKNQARAATKDNVLAALRRIRDNGKPGDEFEFNLNAHGFRSCPDDASGMNSVSTRKEMESNSVQGCQHIVALADPETGAEIRIPTEEFAKVIREIDAKGIKTNVNLQSCHAGAAQDAFGGLRNTCVLYGSSANNFAFSCMPNDPEGDPSFTSAVDNVVASHYVQFAAEMKADEYFRNDKCLDKISRHYSEKRIGGANRYDLFMSARRWDENGEEPSLSSQQNRNYFKSGLLVSIGALYGDRGSDEICADDVDSRIAELESVIDEARKNVLARALNPKRAQLRAEIDRYNDLIRQQIAAGAIDLARSTDGNPVMGANKDPERLKDLQKEALQISKRVMLLEREIVQEIDSNIAKPASDPCLRS